MKVRIDQETCIRCRICVETCPEIFTMAEDEILVSFEILPEEAEERVRQAAADCAVEAIIFEE